MVFFVRNWSTALENCVEKYTRLIASNSALVKSYMGGSTRPSINKAGGMSVSSAESFPKHNTLNSVLRWLYVYFRLLYDEAKQVMCMCVPARTYSMVNLQQLQSHDFVLSSFAELHCNLHIYVSNWKSCCCCFFFMLCVSVCVCVSCWVESRDRTQCTFVRGITDAAIVRLTPKKGWYSTSLMTKECVLRWGVKANW